MHETAIPFLREVVVFLVIAAILVPLFQRVRISPVLGFLLAGVVIGPFGLGAFADQFAFLGYVAITDIESVRVLAEFGVVFLLFLIGLELSLERLWSMRRLVLGLGSTQVLVTGLAIGAVAFAWGNSLNAAILIGASFALSSTAVVVEELIRRKEFSTRVGRASFSVLLFQDLSVVPILILVSAFTGAAGGSFLEALAVGFGVAIAAAVAIFVLGRIILRPLFRLAASARAPEFFVAITLLTVIGVSATTAAAGLSLALGAFLAGLLLAETEFRHQIEVDVQPFKGLLMGLFFLTVGMSIDLQVFAGLAPMIILSVVGLIALKAGLLTILGRMFGLPLSSAVHTGLLLGQAGEFGLLVVGLAVAGGLIASEPGQFFLIVAGLAMMVTPVLAIAGARVAHWLERGAAHSLHSLQPAPDEIAEIGHHVIIAGYGRVGAAIAALLREERIDYVALDLDSELVGKLRAHDEPVFFGDGRRADVLAKVGAERASAIVLTLDVEQDAEQAVRDIRKRWPDVQVYARARDLEHAAVLDAAGATRTIPELAESSLQMGAFVLSGLGLPQDAVNTLVDRLRERGYEGI
ncbi:MAG: potassium transporter [Rhodospirillaceae bacterium]|mgnify:FL=1|jgi:monovalent cation:proton antiporter-2 (CPA2) family protein|nr:potassium transporter [Rhodospirillaceae bacterium]MBT5357321.1 potassium transporter [Rhodospirillaceae bacterium]MBT5770223.1 potassium transporter [Rhodospirillaceae bacterium]MBT6311144.1 potassium transporter [Rhodospirillaceae bacterium]